MSVRVARNQKPQRFVCVRLMGGLGNQMFQYAAGRALSLRCQVPLYLDRSWLKHSSRSRSYSLSPFRLQALDVEQHPPPRYTRIMRIFRLARGIDRRILHFSLCVHLVRILFRFTFYKERHMDYNESFHHLRPSIYLYGYMQAEGYFKSVAPMIRKDLDLACVEGPRTRPLLKKIQQPNTVSVHVRKGDYTPASQLPLSYYEKAVQLIGHLVVDPHFFVFSDEIDKAEVMLRELLNTSTYVSDPCYSMHEEMLLMSRCAHHIMANSTFSWWAVWLAPPHPNKHVFASRLWYAGAKLKRLPDIHCDEWILL